MSDVRRKTSWRPALTAIGAVLAAGALSGAARAAPAPRPNILVIVADDMGYSDLGAFGGEIATPNLDALAKAGTRLTDFHTAPTCSPTRSMLLTGVDSHEAGVGVMAEMRLGLAPAVRDLPAYQGVLNRRAPTIAERLHDGGYFTVMAGKWHMGLEENQSPQARGFDRSYALLNGGHDHFGDDQGQAWVDAGVGTSYRENGVLTRYPVGAYSSDVFTGEFVSYLGAAKASGKPFFGYLTYTEPHWPLQAPAADIARYKGRYDAGYDVLRSRRLARMKALGLIAPDAVAHAMTGVKPWASLTAVEKAVSARKMEVYAAMVDHLDHAVGKVIAALKANGQYDNTVIVFLSDNGPDPSDMDAPIGMKGMTRPEQFGLDNSYANMGGRNGFISYGPGWAQAASAPSNGAKGAVTEGGIRTTAFIWGKGVAKGRIEPALTHVMDIVPTALSLAGVAEAATPSSLPIRGRSWAGLLAQKGAPRGDGDQLGWEFGGSRALRQGDWKLVWNVPPRFPPSAAAAAGPSHWSLYELKADRGETRDLAAEQPERLQAMIAAWQAYAKETGAAVQP